LQQLNTKTSHIEAALDFVYSYRHGNWYTYKLSIKAWKECNAAKFSVVQELLWNWRQ